MINDNSWILNDRQFCDCEMIIDGSYSPLNGFMNQSDYQNVVREMRLSNGKVFPIPITLDVTKSFLKKIKGLDTICLRNKEGFKIATMEIESIWEPDLELEAKHVYGSLDQGHPAVRYLFNSTNKVYLGGTFKEVMLPAHYDYKKYRISPKMMKLRFKELGWKNIIAFQTRNPLHKAHVEMTMKSMKSLNANLLLHPVIGLTRPGDIDHFTRVRCYEHIIKKYPQKSAILALLPLAMRMGGPREAVLHAIIRKNYGCTHIIIGRDHAGPGLNSAGEMFYGPFDAQKLLNKFSSEIGIEMVPFNFMVYVPKIKKYREINTLNKNEKYETISGTKLRKILDEGSEIPKWFTYPEVAEELKLSKPPLKKRGFCVFFTGLSGSGKSTIANGLLIKLLEHGSRSVTLLDGDIVRTHLSSELGFSKEHRSINVRRIGYVASEVTKNGGVAICAPIAPYKADRDFNRALISNYGGFFEIFINTKLEKCEERDSKGLYSLAREGKIKEFTGVSDPYEEPIAPDLTLNSDGTKPPVVLVQKIFEKLGKEGYL